ncbi:MAG: response regulator [Acidimicrobiia bacterium]
MAQRILLVEDDRSVREAVSIVLERAGFQVESVTDGGEALDRFTDGPGFEAVILDLMLPTMNGFDVCRAIRAVSRVPIVMLTARDEPADMVAGLELGADDYVTKPFEAAVLAARLRAVLRRVEPSGIDAERLSLRDLTIDEAAFRAYRGEQEIRLTAIEFRLLAELVRHAGSVLTRQVLLERVWGYDYLGDSRLVDMAVKRLRDKLEVPEQPPYVTTVRGVGYRFERG